jgi:hypothetical protein
MMSENLKFDYNRELIHFSRKPPDRRRKEKTGAPHPGHSVQVHYHAN